MVEAGPPDIIFGAYNKSSREWLVERPCCRGRAAPHVLVRSNQAQENSDVMGAKPSNRSDSAESSSLNLEAMVARVRAEVAQRQGLATGVRSPGPATTNGQALPSAEEIMARVRAEVVRDQAVDVQSLTASSAGQVSALVNRVRLPRWQPAAARLPEKREYVVGDFLGFDDADFIDITYRALLRRPSDAKGRQNYLNALRSGVLSKVEILGLLRFSEEGRKHNVHVDGLLLPYTLQRWRHIRGIGWVLGTVMAIFRLPRLAWRLQGMEASAAREAHELGRLLAQVEDVVERQFDQTQSIASRVDKLHDDLAATSDSVAAIQEMQTAHKVRQDELGEALRTSEGAHTEAARRLAMHDEALARLHEQARGDQRSVRAMLDRLTVFLDVSMRKARAPSGGEGEERPSLEAQYASFEHTFRGDREQIKQRAAHYLTTLAGAGIGRGEEGVIVDLGSGRGEWLEVLAEHGYHGRGVDTNRGMLEASRERGYEVVEADALDYLRTQPNNSFAAITSMHMVEHIPHPAVIELLDEALRVLRPGGVLILETPNPENVLVGSCMFYMDPTHLHPIPPQLLQWTVQARGFENVVIERLSEYRGAPDLAPVSHEVPGAAQINQIIAWFSAPPDYAVVARKPLATAPSGI